MHISSVPPAVPPYCLAPGGQPDTFSTSPVAFSPQNRYVRFKINMPPSGTHNLEVIARCDNNPSVVINLSPSSAPYTLPYTLSNTGTGINAIICLELESRIEFAVPTCTKFRVFFKGQSVTSERCITNIGFQQNACRKINKCNQNNIKQSIVVSYSNHTKQLEHHWTGRRLS